MFYTLKWVEMMMMASGRPNTVGAADGSGWAERAIRSIRHLHGACRGLCVQNGHQGSGLLP